MKIKTIAAIMKKAALIKLYQHNGEQYISSTHTLYNISNLPQMSADQLCAVLDIPDDKKSSYNIDILSELPPIMKKPIDDYGFCDDNFIERNNALSVNYLGGTYEALEIGDKVCFIDISLLKPFTDVKDGVDLYDRYSRKDDIHYIVVKAGFLLLGVIMPSQIVDATFVSHLANLEARVKRVAEYKEYKRRLNHENTEQALAMPLEFEDEEEGKQE